MNSVVVGLVNGSISVVCCCLLFLGCKKSQDGGICCQKSVFRAEDEEVQVQQIPEEADVGLSDIKANAREVIVHMNVSHKNRIQQVCDRIDALEDASRRYALFKELMDSVLTVDLSDLGVRQPGGVFELSDTERVLGGAYSALQYVTEEVWKRLMLHSDPPEQQLAPWLQLIKKLKSEDDRMKIAGQYQEEAVEFVERWFGKYVKAGSFQNQGAIKDFELDFADIVGRPIRK